MYSCMCNCIENNNQSRRAGEFERVIGHMGRVGGGRARDGNDVSAKFMYEIFKSIKLIIDNILKEKGD